MGAKIADGLTNKINVTSHAGTMILAANNSYSGNTTIDTGRDAADRQRRDDPEASALRRA